MTKQQIAAALSAGKRVLCREIVTEAVYLESIFEDHFSWYIRHGKVKSGRSALYNSLIRLFREKIAAGQMKEQLVRRWMDQVLAISPP